VGGCDADDVRLGDEFLTVRKGLRAVCLRQLFGPDGVDIADADEPDVGDLRIHTGMDGP